MNPSLSLFESLGVGERIRELEYQLSSQQETFSARMRDMENIVRRQEEMLANMKINGES